MHVHQANRVERGRSRVARCPKARRGMDGCMGEMQAAKVGSKRGTQGWGEGRGGDDEHTWPAQRSDERAGEPLAHAVNALCLHSPPPLPRLGAAPLASLLLEGCEPPALGGALSPTCSWPRMMMPWGLMACQEARFSPAPRCSPSWYADHLPSRVVHATQTWCQALSFRLSGSWATFTRRARAQHSVGLPEDPGVPPAPRRASGGNGTPDSTDIWMRCFSLSKPTLVSRPPHPPHPTASTLHPGPLPPSSPNPIPLGASFPRSVEAREMRAGASLPFPSSWTDLVIDEQFQGVGAPFQ